LRIVAWRAGGRSRGTSPSNPSSTLSSPSSGHDVRDRPLERLTLDRPLERQLTQLDELERGDAGAARRQRSNSSSTLLQPSVVAGTLTTTVPARVAPLRLRASCL
jgi:hypothetical protein